MSWQTVALVGIGAVTLVGIAALAIFAVVFARAMRRMTDLRADREARVADARDRIRRGARPSGPGVRL